MIKAMKVNSEARDLKHRDNDAGIDVALVNATMIRRGHSRRIPLGWAFEMPPGWHLLALQKSRHSGKFLIEAPLIDNAYRGEIHACIHALQDIYLLQGEYVLQLMPVFSPPNEIEIVTELSDTERGSGGFGSTES